MHKLTLRTDVPIGEAGLVRDHVAAVVVGMRVIVEDVVCGSWRS
jgi:hypothetical protein